MLDNIVEDRLERRQEQRQKVIGTFLSWSEMMWTKAPKAEAIENMNRTHRTSSKSGS